MKTMDDRITYGKPILLKSSLKFIETCHFEIATSKWRHFNTMGTIFYLKNNQSIY